MNKQNKKPIPYFPEGGGGAAKPDLRAGTADKIVCRHTPVKGVPK